MMKAAIVGLGPHGHRVLYALQRTPGVEVTAVVDRSAEALQDPRVPAAASRHRSTEELFEHSSPNLVCIATNGPSHCRLALQAIEAGSRYLLVEKPMACSLAECDRMISTAERHGALIAVDHPRRYTPAYQWIREQVSSGRWGTPRCLWIQRPGIGLGCLATHSFDLARFITGREVERVTGWVDDSRGRNPRGEQFEDPGGLVILEMEGGLRAVVAQIEDGAGPMSVELDLTAARIRLDEKQAELEVIERDLSVKKGPDRPAAYRRLINPEGLSPKRDLRDEIRLLLAQLIEGGSISADAQQGRISIEILVAAHLSERGGNQPVPLPLNDAEQRELWLPVT